MFVPVENTFSDKDIFEAVDALVPQMIRAIQNIVRIDSVQGSSVPEAPFGAGVKKALTQALIDSAELGFATENIGNHMGYASFGSSKEYVCAVGHLDVVPTGTGWTHEPFGAEIVDGIMYGRGVLDNKGPIYTCLYALAALKKLGFKPKTQIRIIFGCNEETGFTDLEYYLAHQKPPCMGFTPDCKYPVVYAERGRLVVRVLPHRQTPEDLAELLNDRVLNARDTGEAFGIAYADKEFGKLQIKNYRVDPQLRALEMSISYPAGITADELVSRMRTALPNTCIETITNWNPVRFDRASRLVQTLRSTYERVTGLDGTPVTTTGGTYAKLMPHIVPFGPSFPGQKGIGHLPDEWMALDDLVTNAKIYALSLYELSR